jgi:predicted TIM-barrel fold metal-dependent hydrolase
MKNQNEISRRSSLKYMAATGALAALGQHSNEAAAEKPAAIAAQPLRNDDARKTLFQRVFATPLIDTHEHLIEEKERLQGASNPRVSCDDWAFLLSHYLDSDLNAAGMPRSAHDRFFSPKTDPGEKWALLEPYWPAVKNTGYGQAVRLAVRELYEVEDLSAATIGRVQAAYERTRRPGFYREILNRRANIESCQVNCLTGEPFKQSDMPDFLMQDIGIVGMFAGPAIKTYSEPTGIKVGALSDWHRVIDWWFEQYGSLAVAVKSQQAYSRDIDYAKVSAETAAPLFKQVLEGQKLGEPARTQLEDHLFWHAVEKATACGLPVKLHTGYYAGDNYMPLERVRGNPASAARLCRLAPGTKFVFMHIGYPYYEEMLAVAKHYTNACIDMCWSWIINPVAAKDFLKKFLVAAPANKILTFGGDYIPVEPVLGHALIARRGIALALSELVEEGWIGLDDALALVDPIMHGNARKIFHLEAKTAALKKAPWLK